MQAKHSDIWTPHAAIATLCCDCRRAGNL